MINLLPTSIKEQIIYGRRNRTLIYWLLAVVVVIGGISGMTVFGQIFINNNANGLQAVAQVTKDRINEQDLTSTRKDIQALSSNFKTVTQLLGKQVLFSKIFNKIGSIMPEGAILSSITLSTSSDSLDLNVISVDKESATQAFVNISDPKNGLFEKADLVSVGCTPSTQEANPTNPVAVSQSKYPCSASIKVIIKTDSSFYFLSSLTDNTENDQ